VKIADLPSSKLRAHLGNDGISIITGPFVIRLQSGIPFIFDAIKNLYADFSIANLNRFVDFHASLRKPRGLRRYVRPQALFESDGEIPFYPMPLRTAVPLLEWGLNWCVAARAHQYLILHAAVLERGGRALVLPAPSGTGKSTLCAALCWRGWRLLTDELCLIRRTDIRIDPIPRPISLKDASIRVIRSFASEAWIGPECTDTAKGTIAHMRPPPESVARSNESALPAWVVFVNYCCGSPAILKDIPRSHAFLQLAQNSVNYSLLGTAGFEAMAHVIDSTSSYEFTYGDLDDAVKALDDLQQQKDTAQE
jgi:HprK-related kinase A